MIGWINLVQYEGPLDHNLLRVRLTGRERVGKKTGGRYVCQGRERRKKAIIDARSTYDAC